MLNFLSTEEVITVHHHVVSEFSSSEDPVSPSGVRDQGLLESAVSRQHTGYGEVLIYDTPHLNCATLLYGICSNHPFHNGNKRTALISGIWHLDRNNFVIDSATGDDLYRFMKRVARHKTARPRERRLNGRTEAEINAIADWLKKHSRKTVRGERPITYGQLYRIIQQFGFQLGEKRGNKQEILRDKKKLFGGTKTICVCKVSCPGDSKVAPKQEIKHIRQELKLTEEYGVDSASFYDTQTVVDEFVRKNRNVLRRLAQT